MKKLENPVVGIAALSSVLMSMIGLTPGLNDIMIEYSISPASAALLLTIPPLFIIPFTLVGARVTKYVAKKTVALLAILLVTLSGVLPFFLQNFTLILATRALLGVGLGFLQSIGPTLSADYYPFGPKRDRATGIQGAFAGGGGLIYAYLGGWLCSISVRAIFLLYLVCLIPFLILLITLPKHPPAELTQVEPPHGDPHGNSGPSLSKGNSKRRPDAMVVSYVVQILAFMILSMTLSLNISQVIVGDGIGTSVNAGTVTSLFSVGGLIVGFTFAYWLRSLKQYVLPVGTLFSAIGLIVTGLSRSLTAISIASVIGGIGLNLFITACIAGIGNLSAASRNTSMSIFMSVNNLGQFLSPYVISLLVLPLGGDARTKILLAGGLLVVLMAVQIIAKVTKRSPNRT